MHTFFITGDVISTPSEILLYEAKENPLAILITGAVCIVISVILIKLFRKKK